MENTKKFRPDPQSRLMDQVRQIIRYHYYAYRTEKTYCDWIVRYIKFHGGEKHPPDMAKSKIEAFLSHLPTHENVAVSTQRQALNAIVFLIYLFLVFIMSVILESSPFLQCNLKKAASCSHKNLPFITCPYVLPFLPEEVWLQRHVLPETSDHRSPDSNFCYPGFF